MGYDGMICRAQRSWLFPTQHRTAAECFFLAGALMIDEYLIIFMMDDFYVLAYYGVFIYG
jgi:hypothetical protein